jgi:peptide methionine sulfoxide reductase msrA/msrB
MSQAMDRTGLGALVVIALGVAVIFALGWPFGRAESAGTREGKERYMSQEELKKRLTPEQFHVTQEEGTERPFRNAFWDNHAAGLYVDVVSGEPLFSSKDKFDSGTGWPSFTQPVAKDALNQRTDFKIGVARTEVRSKLADSHLGHVFEDGPAPTGMRFCINSAALRFVAAERLAIEGYGEFVAQFPEAKQVALPEKETTVLAGGCFWGMEDLIRKIPGVISTRVGYAGGSVPNATYDKVKKGNTGAAEAVEVVFDPKVLSFEALLLEFFRMHDPTTENRQGNDIGTQYRSAVFAQSTAQRRVADKVIARVNASKQWPKPVVTRVEDASLFAEAEDYHQDYLVKNPGGYTCHFVRKLTF